MTVFISGGTGYVGQALIAALLPRGHRVRALARAGSESKLPSGCEVVAGNALDESTFAAAAGPMDAYVHLVGVSHPAPWKEKEFRAVDLASARASIAAARTGKVRHFIYVSVAHPAPVMKAYIRVRSECEAALEASGLRSTIVRPWYVLGPGHLWPYALIPLYALFERIPATADSARRLGLVTLAQMTNALVWAVENPPTETRVLDVPAIRSRKLIES